VTKLKKIGMSKESFIKKLKETSITDTDWIREFEQRQNEPEQKDLIRLYVQAKQMWREQEMIYQMVPNEYNDGVLCGIDRIVKLILRHINNNKINIEDDKT